MSENCEQEIMEIYAEAEVFFAGINPMYGYKILNSPPKCRPLMMIIGYQPSGGLGVCQRERELGHETHWPENVEYVTANRRDWRLAGRLRDIFGEHLRDCVGTNAIWARWTKRDDYIREVSMENREKIETFCEQRLLRVIDIIDPQHIIVMGITPNRIFEGGTPDVHSQMERNGNSLVLTRTSNIGNRAVLACMHLTGAHITNEDREIIRTRLRAWVGLE